jgi:hypothetical protein
MTIDAFPEGGILMAVTGFGGFATGDEFISTAAKLRTALKRDGRQTVTGGPFSEAWAQYDSPYVIFVSISIAMQYDPKAQSNRFFFD